MGTRTVQADTAMGIMAVATLEVTEDMVVVDREGTECQV